MSVSSDLSDPFSSPDSVARRIARLKARIAGLKTAGELSSTPDDLTTRRPPSRSRVVRADDTPASPREATHAPPITTRRFSHRHKAPVAGFTYRRRNPQDSVLHNVVSDNLPAFLARAEQSSGGYQFPRFVNNALESFIRCGDPRQGLARFRCRECGAERFVAFSCKHRLCPSCGAKRMTSLAMHLVNEVIPRVPVRMWVLSFPVWLRYRLAYDHELYRQVIAIFDRHVCDFYEQQAAELHGVNNGSTGSVHFQQVAGGAINLNPHSHSAYIEGVFEQVEDERGTAVRFHPGKRPTDAQLRVILSQILFGVLELLRDRGILVYGEDADGLANEEPLLAACCEASVQNRIALGPRAGKGVIRVGADPFAKWAETYVERRGRLHVHRDGFDLHARQRIHANDRQGLERSLRYCARPPLCEDRLQLLPNGRVRLTLRKRWNDGTSYIEFEQMELVEKLAALVPRPHINLVIYRGVLAPNHKVRSLVVAYGRQSEARASDEPGQCPAHYPDLLTACQQDLFAEKNEPREETPRKSPNPTWALAMQRAFDLDVLECPRPGCPGRMKFIAFIIEAKAIDAIIQSLGIRPTLRPAPYRAPPADNGPLFAAVA